MRNFSKKALCLLSSAVLLCGASAIPASAAETAEITTFSRSAKEIELINELESAKELKSADKLEIAKELEFEKVLTTGIKHPIVTTTTTAPAEESEIFKTLPDGIRPKHTGLTTRRPFRTNTTTTTTTTTTTSTTTTAPKCNLSYAISLTSAEIGGQYTSAYISVYKKSDCVIPANATISYQWYNGNSIITGATRSDYTASSAGSYWCKISVAYNNGTNTLIKTFNTDKCTVTEKLAIKTQPKGGYLYKSGDTYTLSVEAKGGTSPYKYEWLLNNYVVGTNRTYNATKAGTYKCRITDAKGNTVTSNSVYVTENFLYIVSQPKDVVICDEKGRYLYVNVNGGKAPYTYKWYSGRSVIGTTSSVKVTNPGSYYCAITDANGTTVISNTVKATINFYNLKQGLPKVYNIDNTRTTKDFTVSVTGGTGYYEYVWQTADIGSSTWTEFYRSDVTTATSNTRNIYLNAYNKKYRCIIYCKDGNSTAASVTSGVMNVTKPLKVTEVKNYTENGYYYVDFKVEGGYGSYSTTGVYSNLGSNVYRTRAKIYSSYTGSGSTYQSGAGWYSRIFYDYYAEKADITFKVTDGAGNSVDKSESRKVGSYSVKTGEDTWANF